MSFYRERAPTEIGDYSKAAQVSPHICSFYRERTCPFLEVLFRSRFEICSGRFNPPECPKLPLFPDRMGNQCTLVDLLAGGIRGMRERFTGAPRRRG
jgi:hypothetical protein